MPFGALRTRACVHQVPAAVSSTTMLLWSSTMRPPPTAPPLMCSRAPTNTAPCWYRAVGMLPARTQRKLPSQYPSPAASRQRALCPWWTR